MKTIQKFMMSLLMIFLISIGISPQANGQGLAVFSTPGSASFTVPPGVTTYTIKLWGAGGGGGNATGANAQDGQGGGGGGAFQILNINVLQCGIGPIFQTYTLNVGAGGTAGNPGGNTTAGGTFIASGGAGSSSGNGFGGAGGVGVAQTSFCDVASAFAWNGGNGGASTNPFQTSFGGGGGGRADNGANGGNGGNGGTSGSGAPGVGGTVGGGTGGNTSAVGGNATSYGGGGGGRGFNGATSGTGGNGRIEFSWACPTLTSISYPSPTVCSYSSALNPTILPATAIGGGFTSVSGTLAGFLNATTGAIATGAPQGTHIIKYGWAAFGGCPADSVSFTLTITPRATATNFSYANSPYCNIAGTANPTITTTGVAGTFSSTAGLSIDATTGAINTGASTPGNYVVTYNVPANGNCLAVTATANVTITALPTITGFDYPPSGPNNSLYCNSPGTQAPTFTQPISNPNNNTITYTASPSGLVINSGTGVVNTGTSSPGIYTVTLTIAAGAGCAAVTASTGVTILARPTATIAYTGNPFCQTVASTLQPVSITGVTGGPLTVVDWTATPAGLTINSTNGTINLNSAPGTYAVKYRFTGTNGCLDSSSTSVTIKPRPTSTISYTGPNPICSNISPTVSGNVTAVGPWTLTLSNGQSTTGTGNGPWSIAINTLNPGDMNVVFSVTGLVDANCNGVANPDMPGSITISKRTITSGVIPNAANTRVCEGQDASINVKLTSMANCSPNPRFSGVFAIEYYNGISWLPHPTNPTFAWTSNTGASTTGTDDAITIPANILNNPNSYTLQYRISWVSLVDCNGCSATPMSGSVIVEIVPNPLLNITAAPTGDVCPGTVVPFTISQAANSYVQSQHALFNWVAVATPVSGAPFVIGQGQNVPLGSINVTSPSCPFNGTVTLTVTPLNTSCCNCLYTPITRTFTVRDITAPVLSGTLPASQTNMNLCFSDVPVGPTAAAIAALYTDNCGAPVTATKSGTPTGNNCAWSVTYTYVMSDNCGNTTTATISYSGGDKTPPALTGTLPQGQTNMNLCFSAIPVGPTAAAIAALYTDNCSGNTVSATKSGTPTGTNCAWSVTYTYVISDNCGNTTTTAITYSGGDKTPPALTGTLPQGQSNINDCIANAPVGPTAAAIAALYTDNCSGNTVSATKSGTPTGTNCAWTVTYTYVISDNCGNTTTTAITYSGGDRTAPTLTGTLPQGQSNINDCIANAPVGPTAAAIAALYTDNCGGAVTATKSGTPTGTNCAWSVTYTYVISDVCGNSTTTSITYSGGDRTAPTLTGTLPQGQSNINDCIANAPVGPTAAAIAALYTDNCGGAVTATKSGTPTGTNCAWSVTYTYVISDVCGNSTTTSITYSGGDRTAPVLSGSNVFPANVTNVNSCVDGPILPINTALVPLNETIAALYTDNCGGLITVTRTGGLANGSTNCNWTYNYTYTISDVCGNSITRAFSVSGSDRTAPVISNTVPTQTLNTGAGANCSAIMPDYRSLVNASDCSGVTLTQLAPNAPGTMVFGFNGVRVVTILATDACGNTSTTTFNVELRDLTAPTAICKPYTLILDGVTGTGTITVANVNNGSFDNCTPTPQLIYSLSQTTFTCANVGQNQVTLSVSDVCGNTSTCTATVTVVDNTKPVITCLGDITIPKDANCTYTMTNMTNRATATDICGAPVITQSIPVGTIFGASVTSMPVTLTATDASGNTATCSFTINFIDVTPPVIAGCPSNITVFTGANATTCTQTATWTPPTATDACIACCTTQTITGTHQPGATFNLGVTTVTYTAVDASGNSSTCSFTVTVVDNTRPVIANCPANISVVTGPNATGCNATATWTEPTATDNCTSSASLVSTRSHAPGATFPVGVTTVTYVFADAAGNTSTTCSFTVTVTDNTKPTVTCPGNITTVPNAAGCLASVVNPNPTFADNCGVTTLTWTMSGVGTTPPATASPTTGINYVGTRSFNVGVTTITYTATDAAGNTQTCSYTVTVNKPLAGVIAGTSTVLQNVNTTSTVSFTVSGGVAPYTIVYTAPTGGFPSAGNHTITTVTGAGGNASTVGGNPNHLITTVPQSNAVPGVYTYTLVSVTDALGCNIMPGTTATVTILAFNHPAPDLTPNVVTQGSVNIPAANTREGYIQVSNVRANPTTGAVEFEVYTPANFNLTINPTTVLANGQAVQNSNFDITFYPGLGYAIKTKSGVIMPANSNLKVGYTLTATGTNLSTGQYIVNITNQTGGVGITVGDDNNDNNRTLRTFKVVN